MVNGVMLGKRYNILSKIGAGGMADVYKAKDIMLNRYVAVKVLKKEYRTDENFVRKFRSEAQAAAGLLHPNIVNVYDVGEDRGLNYMVQELVEGITLKDYIRKKGRLSSNEVISIAIQMCSGIGAAHAAGIIHRDIKPQNIMISKDGKVKVTDFGIAKAVTSNTVSSNSMGSVHYTSPEQARGGFSDQKSDIYSIGITLYEMVTGKVPFNGESTVEIALKHLQTEITPPSQLVPDIPYSLEQIILKCTQKEGARRYANTADLIKDLKRTLVDPDGQFVKVAPLYGGSTHIMTEKELDDIRNTYADHGNSDSDNNYGSEEDDEYDDFQDDDDMENAEKSREELNPGISRIMKILMAVIAVLIIGVAGFTFAKAFGGIGMNKPAVTEKEEQVTVPDLLGMTEDEALKALNELNLGYGVRARQESDTYDRGQICEQDVKAGDKVDKNTKIWVIVSTGIASNEVEVPSVVGYKEDVAQKTLEDAGLKVKTEFSYSQEVNEGEVISQDPAGGTSVEKGSTVTMTVSKGSEKATVPDLIGKDYKEAYSMINRSALYVGNYHDEYSDTVPEGQVISQDPAAGTEVDIHTLVNFIYSKGPEPKAQVPVPPVTGTSLTNAKSLITGAGLIVDSVSYEYSDSVPAGSVISCSPGVGTFLDEGSSVTLVISQGPKTSEPDPDSGSEDPSDNGNEAPMTSVDGE